MSQKPFLSHFTGKETEAQISGETHLSPTDHPEAMPIQACLEVNRAQVPQAAVNCVPITDEGVKSCGLTSALIVGSTGTDPFTQETANEMKRDRII